MGAWVDDFKKSDAPQFKGKSDKERRDMALAAYLSAKRGDKNEDTSDAVKAFLAKGGKIKKLPPAKAQGYHGKDDPGKGMHGMLDKPDTKKIGTRKKAKSMEGVDENYQVQKYTDGKKDGPPKSFGGDLKKATAHASKMGGDHRVHKEAKDKPPFDNAKPVNKDPKDKFGNPIKNRAKHLARQAARKLLNKSKNEGTVNELSPDTKKSYTKKATTDLYGRGLRKGMDIERGSSSLGRTKVVDKDNDRKIKNRHAGIYRAQK